MAIQTGVDLVSTESSLGFNHDGFYALMSPHLQELRTSIGELNSFTKDGAK